MRIGLLGGTFNPIHIGHLLLAEGALEALRLDRIIWIPTHLPPHKAAPKEVSPKDRARMVELSIRNHPAFSVSRIELKRPPPSYTVDTVRRLQREFTGSRIRWFFLLGSDNARELSTWKQIDRLLKLVRFVVISRPGDPVGKRRLPTGVRRIAVETVAISSTEIRQRIRQGRSIRYWVPEPARRYIEEHRLYR